MANHITVLRKNAGYKTVGQVVALLGVSAGMIYQVEEGLKKPGIDLALKMSKLYFCSLEDIFLS